MKNRGRYGIIYTVLACLLALIFTMSPAGCDGQTTGQAAGIIWTS